MPGRSTAVAETAKLHENTFRAVNIALANELALMCDRLGISAWEVIDAAATKPFAFLPHYPGPGLGGDCIPVVPHFLSWRLREYGYSTRLIDAAHEVNASMPLHVIQKIADALNDQGRAIKGSRHPAARHGLQARRPRHARVAVAWRSCASSLARGGDVRYCDPWVPTRRARRRALHESVEWTADEVARRRLRRDAHAAPRSSSTSRTGATRALIVDTRNVVPDDARTSGGSRLAGRCSRPRTRASPAASGHSAAACSSRPGAASRAGP